MPIDRLSGLLEVQPAGAEELTAPQSNRFTGLLETVPIDDKQIEKDVNDVLSIADNFQAPLWLVEDYYGLIKADQRHIADPSEPSFKPSPARPEYVTGAYGVYPDKKITVGEQIRRMDAGDWVGILDPFRTKSIMETSGVYSAVQRLTKEDEYETVMKRFYEVREKLRPVAERKLGHPISKYPIAGFTPDRYRLKDAQIVESYLYKMEEEQTRGFTFPAQVFRGATYLPSWMIAFMLTGGLNKIGDEGAKRIGVKLLGDYAETKAGQVALKTMGWAGGAITRTSLGMPMLVLDETLRRRMPKQMRFGLNNELIVDVEGDTWATAILKGWGSTLIETASESAGEGIGIAARNITGRLPFGGRLLDELAKLKPAGKLDEVFTLAGWNGFLQEVGEERLATILHAVAGTQDFGRPDGDMWERLQAGITQDIQNLPVELAVLSLPGMTRYAGAKIMPAITEAPIGVIPPVSPEVLARVFPELVPTTPEIQPTIAPEAERPAEPTVPAIGEPLRAEVERLTVIAEKTNDPLDWQKAREAAERYKGLVEAEIFEAKITRPIREKLFGPTVEKPPISIESTPNEQADMQLDSQTARAQETMKRAFDQPMQTDIDDNKIEVDSTTNTGFIGNVLHNMGIRSKDGYEPFDSKDFRDIYKYWQLPQDIGRSFPEFEPLYQLLGNARQQQAFTIINALNEQSKPYFELSRNEQKRVDKALLEAEQNPALVYGLKALTKMGLSEKEQNGFLATRTSLDSAKSMLYNLMKDLDVPEEKLAEFEKTIKNYVPHRWYGNWAVVVRETVVEKEKPPTKAQAVAEATAFLRGEEIPPAPTEIREVKRPKTIFMTAVNFGERFRERDRLQKMYPDAEVTVLRRTNIPYEAYQQAPAWAVQRMVDLALEKAQIHSDTAADVKEALADLYKAKGFGMHFIRRTGVPGYTEDLARPVAEYLNGFGWYYSKIIAMHQLPKVLGQVDAKRTPNLYRYSLDYTKYMLGQEQEFAGAKRFAYTWYLWGRISSALLNGTQNFTTGWPVLAKNTNLALPKLLQAMARTVNPRLLSAGEKNMLAEMEKRGLFETVLANEIGAYTVNPVLREMHGRTEQAMAYTDLFRQMERFNRRSMAVALWDSGITDLDQIHKLVNEAHWEYGKGNRPTLWRGYLSPIMTFRSWWLHYMTWTKNEIKAGRISPIARSWLALGIFGGLSALPLYSIIAPLWRLVFGRDLETDIRRSTGDYGRLIARGVPTMIGIDFSESVGPGDIFPTDLKDVVGVFADLYDRGRYTAQALRDKDYMRAAEFAAPQALRSPLSAYRMYSKGAYTMSGRPILDLTTGELSKLTAKEAALKAVGFQPVRAAERRHIFETIEAAKQSRQNVKESWANRIQLAVLEKDRESVLGIIREIGKYNDKMQRRGRDDEIITADEMAAMMRIRGAPAGIPPQYMWPLLKEMAEVYGREQPEK